MTSAIQFSLLEIEEGEDLQDRAGNEGPDLWAGLRDRSGLFLWLEGPGGGDPGRWWRQALSLWRRRSGLADRRPDRILARSEELQGLRPAAPAGLQFEARDYILVGTVWLGPIAGEEVRS